MPAISLGGIAAPAPRMEEWHLIVGLGNPGAQYAKTRHNAGFMLVNLLAARWDASWRAERRFSARMARSQCTGRRILLCQPQTFMNASGEAVSALVGFYRLSVSRLLVVVDDADLPLGQLRMRTGGSSGGHHGLESVERHLSSRGFARLRIGIGRRDGLRELADHVLGRMSPEETELMGRILARAADQTECWLTHGIQKAMNQFNGTVDGPTNEGNKS